MTSFTTNQKGTRPMPSLPSASATQQSQQTSQTPQQQIATIEAPPTAGGSHIPIPIVTCDFASDISTSEANDNDHNNSECKDTLKVSALMSSTTATSANRPTNGTTSNTLTELQVSPIPGRTRALSVGIDTDMVSEFDPSSSDSGVVSRCAVVKPLKFRLCQPIFGKKLSKSRKNHANNKDKDKQGQGHHHHHHHHHKQEQNDHHNNLDNSEMEPAIPKIVKPRDPEKEKRRIARKKEKRATLILGLIMGSFIACWLPFFFLYILTPACPSCKIPDSAFAFAFWLGYMNSALNPAIYTIFNKDFRRAFRRILFK